MKTAAQAFIETSRHLEILVSNTIFEIYHEIEIAIKNASTSCRYVLPEAIKSSEDAKKAISKHFKGLGYSVDVGYGHDECYAIWILWHP